MSRRYDAFGNACFFDPYLGRMNCGNPYGPPTTGSEGTPSGLLDNPVGHVIQIVAGGGQQPMIMPVPQGDPDLMPWLLCFMGVLGAAWFFGK